MGAAAGQRMQPVVRCLPLRVPAERLFGLLASRPFPFWLDSPPGSGPRGRYSVMGADPVLTFMWKGRHGRIQPGGSVLDGDPLDHLQGLLDRFHVAAPNRPLPFAGGAVGYLAYDLGRAVERLPELAADDHGLPDCHLGFYDRGLVIDHATDRLYLCAVPAGPDGLIAERRQAEERLDALEAAIERLAADASTPAAAVPPPAERGWNFDAAGYCRAVERVQDHIAAGDVYQVNISQRLRIRWDGDPLALYLRLRRVNPAPYSAYLRFPEAAILSASPELFLRLEGGRVVTRPIKGTRPRHPDPALDQALRRELVESVKDRAELLMIVDLERNDLGKVCLPGSVQVPELYTVESHPGVHHLVSAVTGRLAPGRGVADLLRATFPGGSITGAPKVRAMEIIEELEPVRRGVYTGAIGCLSFDGSLVLNVAIRTFVHRRGWLTLHAGGGVVADSIPEMEYMETLHKAAGLLRALGIGEEASVVPEGVAVPGGGGRP